MVNSPSEAEVGIEGLCEDKIYILFKAQHVVSKFADEVVSNKKQWSQSLVQETKENKKKIQETIDMLGRIKSYYMEKPLQDVNPAKFD